MSRKYVCSAATCRRQIKSSFEAFLHPLLKCLVCRKCHGEYKTGDFSQFEGGIDEQGDDNYCRLCVDGGDLIACCNNERADILTRCRYSFCVDCIKKNFPNDDVLKADEKGPDFKWKCYVCDPSKMEKMRAIAQDAILSLSNKDLKRYNGLGLDGSSSTKATQDGEVTSTKTVNLVDDEAGSTIKKRKIDLPISSSESGKNGSNLSDTPRERDKSKDRTKDKFEEKVKDKEEDRERDREMEREKDKDKDKDKEREKDKEKEREKDRDKEKERPRDKEKDKEKEVPREMENLNKPHVEPVRPVVSTLKNLKNPSSSLTKPQPSTFITADKNLSAKSQSKLSGPAGLHRVAHSKQLKPTSEAVTPSTRYHLTDQDLKTRLEAFHKIKDRCVNEISSKFDTIFEMFLSKELDNKILLKSEIDDMKNPLSDFQRMIVGLDSLCSSQRIG